MRLFLGKTCFLGESLPKGKRRNFTSPRPPALVDFFLIRSRRCYLEDSLCRKLRTALSEEVPYVSWPFAIGTAASDTRLSISSPDFPNYLRGSHFPSRTQHPELALGCTS